MLTLGITISVAVTVKSCDKTVKKLEVVAFPRYLIHVCPCNRSRAVFCGRRCGNWVRIPSTVVDECHLAFPLALPKNLHPLSSARAAIVNAQGDILGLHVHPIKTWNPRHEIYQQSSDEIWSSICITVRSALAASGVHASSVRGIGFDATCSLVVLDPDFAPLSVDPDSAYAANDQNVILWADHRAADQATRINATKHPVLRYVGDVISLEMEVPKILWLKENMSAAHWKRAAHFFDLPDFLTFRATGSLARSRCSLTCKCSFVPPEIEGSGGWNDEFFSAIGLGEFVEERYKRVGGVPNENGKVLFAGDVVGNGLSKLAAEEMGLMEGTPVGSAVIDAYAGAIATLGAGGVEEIKQDASGVQRGANRLAIICGTSSCHIAMSPKPIFVPGVWG